MSTTLTIAKREFRSYFDSPLAYVVICLGLIMLGVFFFFVNGGFWQTDRATLQQMFFMMPRGLSLVIVPVLTMRLLAEEKRSGTLEMLITLPVKDHEVILGKFLGAFGLVLVLIAATGLFPLMMFKYPWHLGEIDAGPVITGYIGLLLYSAAAVSLGLLISSLTESQVVAFFITWAVLVLLSFLGMLAGPGGGATAIPEGERMRIWQWIVIHWRDVISYISFDNRLAGFSRGVIVTRDIVYFLSITIGSLMLAFRALERRKWA